MMETSSLDDQQRCPDLRSSSLLFLAWILRSPAHTDSWLAMLCEGDSIFTTSSGSAQPANTQAEAPSNRAAQNRTPVLRRTEPLPTYRSSKQLG
jgi:hypothetical protein